MKESTWSFITLILGLSIMMGIAISYSEKVSVPSWILVTGASLCLIGFYWHFKKAREGKG